MGTDIDHVNGAAQLSVVQGFQSVDFNNLRGKDYDILTGQNFEDIDFPTASTLTNWGTLTKAKFVSSWGTATIAKKTINGTTNASLTFISGSLDSGTGQDNGAGKLQILNNPTNVSVNDWIMITDGAYNGIWKVTAVVVNISFNLDATFDPDADTFIIFYPVNGLKGIETNYNLPLGNDISLVDSENQSIKIDVDFYFQSDNALNKRAVCLIVVAWKSTTDYKVLNGDGLWVDFNSLSINPIIKLIEEDSNTLQNITVEGNISDNNFYTSGSPDLYVALMTVNGTSSRDDVAYNSVKLSLLGGSDSSVSTLIDADFTNIKNVDFFHTDGDGDDNEEYLYNHPIYDDATPKRFINSWQQDGDTADNLQDIVQANMVGAYNENSQIWRGQLKGDMTILNAVKDPFNADREFQLQKLSIDAETGFNNVGMIEIDPAGPLTYSMSVTGHTSNIFELPKVNSSSTSSKDVTITNTGTGPLVVDLSLAGGEVGVFSLSTSQVKLDAGDSEIVTISSSQQSDGVYDTILTVEDNRPQVQLSSTFDVGVIVAVTAGFPRLFTNEPTSGTIIATAGGGTVNTNTINGNTIPSSIIVIDLIDGNNSWVINVTGMPSRTTTIEFQNVSDSSTIATFTTSGTSINSSIVFNPMTDAKSNAWDGGDVKMVFL
jgi:hypothetical protein